MTDEKQPIIKINPIPDETTNALLKPAATSVGSATNDLLEGVFNLLLTPVRKYNIVKQKDMEDFTNKIYEKKENIEPENLDDSKRGLVLKTMEDSRYQLNEEEFRERFSNLIVSAMDSSKNNLISPNFSTILSNLTVKEAVLFEKIFRSDLKSVPSITFRIDFGNDKGGVDQLENILIFENEINHDSQSELISLETFGLIKFSNAYLTAKKQEELYKKFESTSLFDELKQLAEHHNYTFSLKKNYFYLTELGSQFAAVTIV